MFLCGAKPCVTELAVCIILLQSNRAQAVSFTQVTVTRKLG